MNDAEPIHGKPQVKGKFTLKHLGWLILVLAVGFLLFWTTIRPGLVKQDCNSYATENEKRQRVFNGVKERFDGELTNQYRYVSTYETEYQSCLREHGL